MLLQLEELPTFSEETTRYIIAGGFVLVGVIIPPLVLIQSHTIRDNTLELRCGFFMREDIALSDIFVAEPSEMPRRPHKVVISSGDSSMSNTGAVNLQLGWGTLDSHSFREPIYLYNLSGRQGLKVFTTFGEQWFVGTREPEELVEAIKRVKKELGISNS